MEVTKDDRGMAMPDWAAMEALEGRGIIRAMVVRQAASSWESLDFETPRL